MTNALLNPVVPAVVLPRRDHNQAVIGPRSTPARRTLPVPDIPTARTHATVYGMAAVDCRGRIADQTVLRALDWTPGRRLNIRETTRLLVIHADPHGVFRVTGQGHLRLSAEVRHCCGLATGDRVLLAADPTHDRLVIYPPAALDLMTAEHPTDLVGGDAA